MMAFNNSFSRVSPLSFIKCCVRLQSSGSSGSSSKPSSSILASRIARTVLKKDETDTEKIPPLSSRAADIPASYRFIYPEFLPHADMKYRDALRERLERQDMLNRRKILNIPEFYVGSIMAVTTSDKHSPTKSNRFLGICIYRGGVGLESSFILRNVVDGLGVEIMYHMYNPTIQKIEVLRLERRLDEQLFYLRDCPTEYSTFPFDMELEPHPAGARVPLNSVVIKANPLPWRLRWEKYFFKGLDISHVELPKWRIFNAKLGKRPFEWEKFDLMKKYRKLVPMEDQEEVFRDVLFFNNAQLEKLKDRK